MGQSRSALRFVAAVLSAALTIVTAPILASADVGPGATCAFGGNKTATICVNGNNGETYKGDRGSWGNYLLNQNSASWGSCKHVNVETWLYTRADELTWVELGIRSGDPRGSQTCADNPPAQFNHHRYWAETDASNVEHFHSLGAIAVDHSVHSYSIANYGGGQWSVYIDSNLVGTSSYQPGAVAYEAQFGMETSNLSPQTSTNTFDMTPLQTSNGATFSNFSYHKDHVDQPCNGVYAAGYCFTYAVPYNYEWQVAKP